MNKEIHGGQGLGAPTGGLVGEEGAGVRGHGRGHGARRTLTSPLSKRLGQALEGEGSGQPVPGSGPRLQLPAVSASEGLPLWPLQSPAVRAHSHGVAPEQPDYTCCRRRCRWEVLRRSLL